LLDLGVGHFGPERLLAQRAAQVETAGDQNCEENE
jgi:hypothetical protein